MNRSPAGLFAVVISAALAACSDAPPSRLVAPVAVSTAPAQLAGLWADSVIGTAGGAQYGVFRPAKTK